MKDKILLIVIILLIIICLVFVMFNENKLKVSKIKSFHYGSINGMEINANETYDLERKGNEIFVTVKPSGVSSEEAVKVIVDENFLDSLEKILIKYRVDRWDGFHKSNKNVMDGSSFSLSVIMEDGSISASGYMKYPKNYGEFISEIDNMFLEIYNKN